MSPLALVLETKAIVRRARRRTNLINDEGGGGESSFEKLVRLTSDVKATKRPIKINYVLMVLDCYQRAAKL